MRRVNTPDLLPGMVAAEDVYTFNSQLIIPKGYTLSDKSITRLEYYSITSIRVEDYDPDALRNDNIRPENDVEEWPFSLTIRNSPEFKEYQENFETSLVIFRDTLNDIVEKGSIIDTDSLFQQTISLLTTSLGSVNFFNMLHNMRQYDDLTFAHCMNVSLICHVFSGWLNLSSADREIVTVAGMLHDIGKLAIPDDMLKKPARLTDDEYRVIKTHTVKGYDFLKDQDINEHIKNAALMHHERCDGSGYPLGLTEAKIDRYAKIVAIADVYDAMTAARVYRGPLCPFAVIDVFEKEGFQKYDANYIYTFLSNIVMTYIHNRVRLNNGKIGDIIYINKMYLSRPMIQCSDEFIDLSERPELFIEAIL